jgi:L-malate glycosyltransferase
MKIAHVVDSMEVGGAETLVHQMCRMHRAQGDDARVYTVGNRGVLGEQMRTEGFQVEANAGLHLVASVRKFYRAFRQWRPDVVHLHNPTPTFYAAAPARAAGVPSVLSTRHSLVAPPRRAVVELKYALAAACCDWIIGICDATTNNLRTLHTVGSSKIVRVYNGVEPLELVPAEERPFKTGFTLLYVGRFAPIKNHTLLLHAFQKALSTSPELRLWMVGDGSERRALERLAVELNISGAVTFWGEQLDVSRFYSAADVFIMSSHSEGLPLSLLQAFSLGLPAIVTDVGGMAEVVRLADAGFVVPPTEQGSMASAIVRMTRDKLDRERFSAAGKAAFSRLFTLETMVSAYAELYWKPKRGSRRLTNG